MKEQEVVIRRLKFRLIMCEGAGEGVIELEDGILEFGFLGTF